MLPRVHTLAAAWTVRARVATRLLLPARTLCSSARVQGGTPNPVPTSSSSSPATAASGASSGSGAASGGGGKDVAGMLIFGSLVRAAPVSAPRARGCCASPCCASPHPCAHEPRVVQVVTTLGLGTWQAQRYVWKRDLIASRYAALEAEPKDITRTPYVDGGGCLCRRGARRRGYLMSCC
ncbi:hypothetical protein EON67_04645 [archaeon]|nr:MAG: hypothetical protein EON67_04645 [archaeon]